MLSLWYVSYVGAESTVLVLVTTDLCMDHGVTLSKFLPNVFAVFDLRRLFCSPRPLAKEHCLGQP